tara:strand:- start:15398 stop:15676 length:279 start_codon:yes stop_codon:yes gene_type:complete
MFASRYFNPRYWASRYWPKIGGEPVLTADSTLGVFGLIEARGNSVLSAISVDGQGVTGNISNSFGAFGILEERGQNVSGSIDQTGQGVEGNI